MAINRTTTSVQRGIEEPGEFQQFVPGMKSGSKWKPAELKFDSPGFHDRMMDPSFRAALSSGAMPPPAPSPSPSYGTTAFREGGRSPSGGRGMTPIPTSFKPTVMPPGAAGIKTSTMSGPTSSTYKSPFETGAFSPETFEPAESYTPKTYGPDFDYTSDDPDFSWVPSEIDKLRSMRRDAGDPLWGAEAVPSRGLTSSIKGADDVTDGGLFSRYYVPGYEHTAKAFEGGKRDFGWGHLLTGARGKDFDGRGGYTPLSDIPGGMTPEEFGDKYMAGVTGVLEGGRKWYGDPADYAAGKIAIEPHMYDPETGTFVRPTGRRISGDLLKDPVAGGWTPVEGEEGVYEKPWKTRTGRDAADLELGSFVRRGDEGFSSLYRDASGLGAHLRGGDRQAYAFTPTSGDYRFPSGVSSRVDPSRGEKLRAFYGDEVIDKLRHAGGERWLTDSELDRKAKEEGWSTGGKIKHGKFIPTGGYIDSKGLVFDINCMPYVQGMESL